MKMSQGYTITTTFCVLFTSRIIINTSMYFQEKCLKLYSLKIIN